MYVWRMIKSALEINRLPVKHLKQAVELLGEKRVERELNVHRTTVRRWLAGRVAIPGKAHQVIRMLLGDLPGTDGKWTGWRFHDGDLVSPEGVRFTPGDVRAIPMRLQMVNQLHDENLRLKILRSPSVAGALLEHENG